MKRNIYYLVKIILTHWVYKQIADLIVILFFFIFFLLQALHSLVVFIITLYKKFIR